MFGRYIEITVTDANNSGERVFKVATPLKRYWQTDLWNRLYHLLLNPTLVREDESLPLTDELSEIENEMANWLKGNCDRKGRSLKNMLNQIYQFTTNRGAQTQRK
jgi:checkpoint serine/threonine-protein kinase